MTPSLPTINIYLSADQAFAALPHLPSHAPDTSTPLPRQAQLARAEDDNRAMRAALRADPAGDGGLRGGFDGSTRGGISPPPHSRPSTLYAQRSPLERGDADRREFSPLRRAAAASPPPHTRVLDGMASLGIRSGRHRPGG
eukprot:365381-Chlamydomonas_euryale.AAC.25